MSPRHRTALTASLAAGLLLTATGCGVGRSAQTYQERTAADSTSQAVGLLDLRNLAVLPPLVGEVLSTGSSARAVLTVVSDDTEPDRLLSVSSPAAGTVVVIVNGRTGQVVVPPKGSTGNAVELVLQELTGDFRTGTFVPMTLRFERNGAVDVQVPVRLTGRTERPITGGPGNAEGEPALGGPAGGHGEGAGEG